MSVTSVQLGSKERYLDQIEKLTRSHTLRKAEGLCKLLRYLADHELAQPGIHLKEYQIAIEVFGRPHDFDPQADSAVRVQAGRLRFKLIDYYRHEGLADTIVVEVPNGSYTLTFREREAPVPALVLPPESPRPTLVGRQPEGKYRPSFIVVPVLSVLLVVASAAIAMLAVALGREAKRSDFAPPAALNTFWSQFASGPEAPWVIFSNAAFVGRPETGMRYLDPAHDSRDLILDHYTGVGEVLAVHELDRVFNLLNHPIQVKRGSLFSLDDAKKNDLIFVGSPAENLTLRDLPSTQEFIFKRQGDSPHKGVLSIINSHPEPGQPDAFYPSSSSQPLAEDYAIIALFPGLNRDRHVMILAGTTTIGTEAAVEYVCAKDSVEELLRSLHVSGGEVKPFEALLRVKVTRGVPVGVQLLAVRARD